MSFKLMKLPYEKESLVPYISSETVEYHHEKHHQNYVLNLNKLIDGTTFEGKTLEEIIQLSSGAMFNNAAQVWNHNFYWNCLSNNGCCIPNENVKQAINASFGNFNKFKDKFINITMSIFGSGWSWLVQKEDGLLEILSTIGAENPITNNYIPLLTCDVWEHAYYIDYRNLRLKYLEAFWNLINWNFVEKNLKN